MLSHRFVRQPWPSPSQVFKQALRPTSSAERILSCNHHKSLNRLAYSELSAGQIRLLSVHKHGDRSSFNCTLHVFSLDKTPEYLALSYTWDSSASTSKTKRQGKKRLDGDTAEPIYEIVCDGHLASVSGNLFDALRRIPDRASDLGLSASNEPGQGVCYIWADALCINQDNLSEKAVQVSMMGKIYANAKIVVVWLGENGPTDAKAFSLIEDFFTALDQAIEAGRVQSGFQELLRDPGIFEKIGLTPWQEEEGVAIVSLLTKKWFSRAWILQEVVVAREIVVLCGELAMHWSTLEMMSNFIFYSGAAERLINIWRKLRRSHEHNQANLDSDLDGRVSKDGAYPIGTLPMRVNVLRRLCDTQRAKFSTKTTISRGTDRFPASSSSEIHSGEIYECFERLIRFFRPSRAVKMKDKIFAPLAIVYYVFSDLLQSSTSLNRQIFPSYKTTTEQTYIEACRVIIENTSRLSILSQVEDASYRSLTTINLPTWTPDFSITDTTYQIDQGLSGDLLADAVFHASHGLDAAILPPRVSGTKLTVSCHKLDTILEVGPGADRAEPSFDEAPAFWLQFCLRFPQVYPYTGQNRVEVLWRTMIADQAENVTPASGSLAGAFYAYCLWTLPRSEHFNMAMAQAARSGQTLASWIELDRLAESSPANSIPRFTDVLDFSRQMDEESEIVNMVEHLSDRFSRLHGRVLPSRRMFRSSRLNMCGIGPMSLREQDEIVLLHGANVPFAVRKVEGSGGECDGKGECDGAEYRLVGECYVHGFMQGAAFESECVNSNGVGAEAITLI